MFNWFKEIDRQYPFLAIILFIGIGAGLVIALFSGYINRPKIIGFAMIGEGLYLLYKRYIKKD